MENRNGLIKLKMNLIILSRNFAKNHFKLQKKLKKKNLLNFKQNKAFLITPIKIKYNKIKTKVLL